MNLYYSGNPFLPYNPKPARQEATTPKRRYKKPLLLTIAEAADYIGVTEGTLRVWRSSQTTVIPSVRIGGEKRGLVRYRVQDLDKYLEKQRNAPEGWDDE